MNDQNYGGLDSVKLKEAAAFIRFKTERGLRYLSDNGVRATWEKLTGKTRDYGEWLMLHEKRPSAEAMQKAAVFFENKPRFSCLINGSGFSIEAIAATADRLKQQGYPFWEGILFGVDALPAELPTSKWQPAADLETAIEKATGNFCICLCAGDLLTTDALFALALALDEGGEMDVL